MKSKRLVITVTLLLMMGSAFIGYLAGKRVVTPPTPLRNATSYAENHLCVLGSDEFGSALAEALTGDPDSTKKFLELGVRCGDDLRMFQLSAALELAFPRDSTVPGSASRNLVLSALGGPIGQHETKRLAFAIALLSFHNRDCESTELVLEALGALGLETKKAEGALTKYNTRAGGEPGVCTSHDFRTET